MGEQFTFGLKPAAARPEVAQGQVGGGVAAGFLGRVQLGLGFAQGQPGGGVDEAFPIVAWLPELHHSRVHGVGQVGLGGGEVGAGDGDLPDRAGLRGVRDQPGEVVFVVGVAVQGIEAEVLAGGCPGLRGT